MRYNKTPKAWAVLVQAAALGRFAHTLLLMANGRRSLGELSLLTGTEASEAVKSLHRDGYLQLQDPPNFGDPA